MCEKPKCCLLVEDDPDDQEFFLKTLSIVSPSSECYAASNGQEALYALESAAFIPDYIITDVNMPKMGGIELISILKKRDKFKNIPVIFYTSDCSNEQVTRVKRLGAVAIYSKAKWTSLKDVLKKYFHLSPTIK